MPAPLSPATIAIVKASVPALAAHGQEITTRMYARMFENEQIRALFNQAHQGAGSQPAVLARAILAYAQNIENLGALGGAVERIAQKHVALDILPEHYPHVATALLAAIADVLGAAATPDLLTAWGEAYWFLAELLIGREAAIYREHATQPGGWAGWREFELVESVQESNVIRSFILRPVDSAPVLRHRPGQYLGVQIDIPGHGPVRRNYSISCAPNDTQYRITVKHEPQGLVSGWLHQQAQPGARLRLTPPAGDFFLAPAETGPVVLLSGGVGLTPMVSMLEALAETNPARPVWHVQAALNGQTHAMGAHLRALAARMPGLTHTVFYSAPAPDDQDYDAAGHITTAWLTGHTPLTTADYYLCGPKPFLHALVNGLLQAGVPQARVHFEFFGPMQEVIEAKTV